MEFSIWPFVSPSQRLPAEEERWWQECYLPTPAHILAEQYSYGSLIIGGYQSGRSTLVAALKRSLCHDFLVVEDEFLNQLTKMPASDNALCRMLRQAIWKVREYLREKPERLEQIRSRTVLEFLRWGIEKFHGQRAYLRWLDALPERLASRLAGIPFEDLYPTQHNVQDVQGQIEEVLNLVCQIGYRGIAVLVDVFPFPTIDQVQELRSLLGWRELMHHAGLRWVIAIPPILNQQEIQSLLRGRLPVFALEVNMEFIEEVLSRYLKVATARQIEALEQICSPTLQHRLEEMIKDEFGDPAVGAWVKLAELLLEVFQKTREKIGEDHFQHIYTLYLSRFCPLHPDPTPGRIGIWRGYRWIELDHSVYEFLQSLVQAGQPVNHLVFHTSKSNLHTLASRLRKALEGTGTEVYLKNTRNEGYSLQHYRSVFP